MNGAGIRRRTADAIERYLLPLGILIFLTGMLWIGSRSGFRSLMLLFTLLPTLALVLLRPTRLALLYTPVLGRLLLVFLAYVACTASWSGSGDLAVESKRLLYLVLFLLMVAAAYRCAPQRVARTVLLAVAVAALAAVLSIVYFYGLQNQPLAERLPGFGALYNPLLSSHVYGSFAALVVGVLCGFELTRVQLGALLLTLAALLAFVLLTQSRTPLLALAIVVAVQVVTRPSRRSLLLAAIALALGSLAGWLAWDVLIGARGASQRLQIWSESWRMVQSAPWFGHGHGADFELHIPGAEQIFYDPHNIPLAVLFYTGAAGFFLWVCIHAEAYRVLLRERGSGEALVALSLLTYGLVAGLTEGGDYASRAKEHWYLIWWPLACVLALQGEGNARKSKHIPATP